MIRPRLTDYHGIYLAQAQTDFAIPFLNEDIPLYIDPFLMWKSPSFQDKSLHGSILNSFNQLGHLAKRGKRQEAVDQIILASECDEIGLGHSAKRKGKRISEKCANEIIQLFDHIPVYNQNGFSHFEEIQFFVNNISFDRISDIASSFMKSFLIDYTIDECETHGIPMADCTLSSLYDLKNYRFEKEAVIKLPFHPDTKEPIILVPKRWLRHIPWINFDEYFKTYCPQDEIFNNDTSTIDNKVKVLKYNRDNYGVVEAYIKEKERTFADCLNDPLFKQIPVISAKRKLAEIKKIPTGNADKSDKKYEDAISQLMTSLMYPHLDFAEEQSRTDSGAHIRDLIFYNNRSHEFLKEIFDDYASKQIIMEIKNVTAIDRDHINQLNRYMTEDMGRFSIFLTRNEPSKSMKKNLIDLWSAHRRCILCLTDIDIAQMVELFESKQRLPLDVLKKKYIQFKRNCPS